MRHEIQDDLFPEEQERIRGMCRRPDHLTSIFAASMVEQIRSKLQRRIIDAFKEYGRMTDEQLENLPRFLHYGISTVKKRRTELYQKGIIVCVGETHNSRGSRMKIWDLREDLRK